MSALRGPGPHAGARGASRALLAGQSEALYALSQVARLTGIRPEQLRRWDKSGLLPARTHPEGHRGYSFPDVIAARAASGLLEQGHTTRAVREAVESVRAWRRDAAHPLASLRIYTDAGRLVVRLDDTLVEPRSGQLVLDLPVENLAQAMLGQLVEVDPRKAEATVTAEEWVQRGLDAEADGLDVAVAERRYRKALELDAEHPGARVNLGNLLYTQGRLTEALAEYRAAVEAAPDYADAWYNLANTLDDQDTPDAAVSAYEEALRLEPDFADAHFNLALLWEKQGQRGRARPCWSRFLTLAPEGASAAIARRFLLESADG